jgi:WD40 repeat protein
MSCRSPGGEGGRQLVSSSDDGTVKRWDATTGTAIETIEFGGVETDTIAIAADGAIFAGNDQGQLVLIRDGRQQIFDAHQAGVKRVVYDEAARRVVTLSYDRSVRIWSYSDGVVEPLSSSSLPPIIWPRSCAFLGTARSAS